MHQISKAFLSSLHFSPRMTLKSLTPKHMRETKVYLNLSRFKGQDALLLYKSREKWFYAGLSFGLLSMIGFNVNSYYDQRYSLELDSSDVYTPLYLSAGLSFVFLALQFRIYKSPIKILLLKDGQTLLVERFGLLGLYSRFGQMQVSHMTGFHSFLHRKSKVPIFSFQVTTRTQGFMFFKREFIQEEELFKQAIQGQPFNVTTQDKNLNLSAKQKQAYGL